MSKINGAIFKSYDIRGVYPSDLDEETAYNVGLAFSKLLKEENGERKLTVVLSHDMRTSSPVLQKSVLKGMTEGGLDVVEIGLSTTPTFYFAVARWDYDGGIQITASHNPKEYNGLKMVRARAVPVSGENGIYKMRDWIINGELEKDKVVGKVTDKTGVVKEEVEYICEQFGIDRSKIKPFKIVVDSGNAMGILDIEELFAGTAVELVKLNSELDGTFPIHPADPLDPGNLLMTKEEVIRKGADMGIVIDGDGDRYFIINNKGEELRQEILRGIMAQIAIKENPGAAICYDIRPGKITEDMIEEAEGKAVVTKVGHSLIKEKMIEVDAVFAGESSGHYYYKFPFGYFDAPMVMIMKFLLWMSEKGEKLSDLTAPLERYFHSGEINSEVEDKEKKISEIAEKYKDAKEISYLDGITVVYDDFWFNVRPSNTEALLRLNLEATSRELMEEKRDEVLDFIRK